MVGICLEEENRTLLGVLIPMFLPPLQLIKDRSYTRQLARRRFKRGLCGCNILYHAQSIVEGHTRSNVAKPPMAKIAQIAIC